MTKNDGWFDIKLLIYCKKGCDIKQLIQYETYRNAMIPVFKKLKIFSTHFVHFGRVIGPIELELNKMQPQYINNPGNWKPDTQYEGYSAKMPINIMKAIAGASENQKFHYNSRTVPKPPDELLRLIFPFIEQCKILLISIDAYDPRPTACDFPEFMERGITVLLQDVAQLINIGRTHILFYREVFKTELFLNYK